MGRLLRKLVSSVSASALMLAPVAGRANPLGGQVTAGSATIAGAGTSNLTINQSTPRAIIDWRSFNLAPSDTTQFNQPSASSVTLNRVTGGLGASQINGAIKANGGVYIVNPDGMLFGPSATINVGSFLGTTHDIANSDFMAGRTNFTIPGNPSASIVNQGSITAASGGFAALVAPGVRNDGIITANLGTVALASGNGFTLDLYGDSLIKLQPSDAIAADVRDVATGQTLTSLVQNTGKLKARGGTVALTAVTAKKIVDSVINSSGVIEANTVGTKGGMVIFGAPTAGTKLANAPIQTVKVSGTIKTAGHKAATKGGKIQITGENIVLAAANLDASGQAGGGTILVGGDFKGGDPSAPAVTQYGQHFEANPVPSATTISVDAASILNASALMIGNGGKVVVWSDDTTAFHGRLDATGGLLTGDGGFAEVSGANTVDYGHISANLSARAGRAGTILFDPTVDTIDSVKASSIDDTLNTGSDVADAADIINLNSNILKTNGSDASLTLTSTILNIADNITIGSSSGNLNISFNFNTVTSDQYYAIAEAIIKDVYLNDQVPANHDATEYADDAQAELTQGGLVGNSFSYVTSLDGHNGQYGQFISAQTQALPGYSILIENGQSHDQYGRVVLGTITGGSGLQLYTNGGTFNIRKELIVPQGDILYARIDSVSTTIGNNFGNDNFVIPTSYSSVLPTNISRSTQPPTSGGSSGATVTDSGSGTNSGSSTTVAGGTGATASTSTDSGLDRNTFNVAQYDQTQIRRVDTSYGNVNPAIQFDYPSLTSTLAMAAGSDNGHFISATGGNVMTGYNFLSALNDGDNSKAIGIAAGRGAQAAVDDAAEVVVGYTLLGCTGTALGCAIGAAAGGIVTLFAGSYVVTATEKGVESAASGFGIDDKDKGNGLTTNGYGYHTEDEGNDVAPVSEVQQIPAYSSEGSFNVHY